MKRLFANPDAPDTRPIRISGIIPMLFLGAAFVTFLLMLRVDTIQYSQNHLAYTLPPFLLALGIPGPVFRMLELPCRLITWNAVGWLLMLGVLGMTNVGSLPFLPLVLVGFAITFWPRERGRDLPGSAIAIAVFGGIAVCALVWWVAETGSPLVTS